MDPRSLLLNLSRGETKARERLLFQESFKQSPLLFFLSLTHYVQRVEQRHLGLRIDLALVYPRVPDLRILDLQRPVGRVRRTYHLETLVRRVGGRARGQDVEVSLTDP